ncbi:ABC transporter permease [Actinomadura verrucosospora]|uniref:Putative thiopeptide-lantipeptide biosynthesis related protein n=1 Tax=Actinomadura verrucosospora TaxID=46165 RepID=A0A7D3VSR3_ACTVE|nr:ABC transporter permease [Actinomadura verrucosospora]QKG21613.1 putative thiopeptide-lantipeptide biosynthesis related protein [Actinomadura verrucosospora]
MSAGSSLGALGRVVRSGVGRRRVQTLVVALATLMSVASAVVAGSLVVASSAPFDHAFARGHGAHLTAQIDAGKATAAQAAATAHLPGVAAAAGPFPVAVVAPATARVGPLPRLTVAGRPSPGGPVDRLEVTAGRWASAANEIVLPADLPPEVAQLGSTLALPGGRTLTVVGRAHSVTGSADAWMTPAGVAALGKAGTSATTQMLYRFSGSPGKSALTADRARLRTALPPGALLGGQTYLDVKQAADREAATFVPFLMAFGALGLAMAVIVVAGVVGGAVGANLRRIGVLKAIGCTPAEIVRAYVAQALVPAAAGTLLGVVLGNLVAYPLLGDVQRVYGTTGLAVAWWVDATVAAGALLVVAAAALVPALRAGRLRTVEAIAVGRAPGTGRGRRAHRLVGRLPLPRTVSLGLATPFARPVRSASMLLAVAFGTAAATFAIGLAVSLNTIGAARDPDAAAAVTVMPAGPGPQDAAPQNAGPQNAGPRGSSAGPPTLDESKVRAAITAQPGTASFYGVSDAQVTVAGVVGPVEAHLYRGDLRAGAYEIIAGRWITGPGQAVVPTRFLEVTGHRIGDTITVRDANTTVRLRIVGEAFDLRNAGMRVHAAAASFAGAKDPQGVDSYLIRLKPGVSVASYVTGLNAALRTAGAEAMPSSGGVGSVIAVLDSLAALLTLMLVTVAGLGVLNAVVLDTRERVHDLGVCKAIGMSPRQTVAMVLASVAGLGAAGGLAGLPVGVALHHLVMPLMGDAAGTRLTHHMVAVYGVPLLVPLALGGIAIAVLGALLPAGWAAKARTATALRTE